LYEENKVQEYWIVNPDSNSIEIFSLQDEILVSLGVYSKFNGFETVQSTLFSDLVVDLEEIFKD
jgi:Uma2 family endonuclease